MAMQRLHRQGKAPDGRARFRGGGSGLGGGDVGSCGRGGASDDFEAYSGGGKAEGKQIGLFWKLH